MSMTTNDQQHPDHLQNKTEELYTLLVTAEVEVIDQSGTVVPARSLAAAIRAIRDRYHDDVPLIALDTQYKYHPLFSNSVQGWLVTDTAIMPIDGDPSTQQPHYRLRYHSFALSDPQADSRSQSRCQVDALVPVAMKAADSAGLPVQLSSRLLGFTQPVLRPGDSDQTPSDTQGLEDSILDGLAADLFTSNTVTPLILVHPPEPVRRANSLTIPDAVGVVYNAEPGEYTIDGEGVSVKASPAEGYQFPDTAITAWDFEYDPAQNPELDTAPPPDVADLRWIVETTDPVDTGPETRDATETPTAEAAPSDPLAGRLPYSKAMVVRTTLATPWWKRRTFRRYGIVAAAALMLVGILLSVFLPTDSGTEPGPPADERATWLSSVSAVGAPDQPLIEGQPMPMWELESEHAAELSWYAAGVAHVDPDDDALILRSTLSGDETARIELEEPIVWTSEFHTDDEAAVGARTESAFHAITAEGDTQTWSIDQDHTLHVSGSTPMLTTDDGEVYALIIGENDPVSVIANPDHRPAAIDGDTLIQFAAGMPRLVTIPISDEAEPAEMRLAPPTDGASFTRHLAVGHGLSLSEWRYQDEDYLVVHDLSDEATVIAAVPSIDDAQGWSIGRGMDLAIIGPYAFNLDTGELLAESSTDFVSAIGDAAIRDGAEGREFIIDGDSFYETSRVIGYTGAGTVILRQPDGSVAAVSESSGTV